MDIGLLSTPFPHEQVQWRAQRLSKKGDKAMALAYIDARDVMDRFDEICQPHNWQVRHTETPRGRILTEIGVRIDGDWVWKSDGAGQTDIEGDKGGISDALKRAAVLWGVGRYLYRLDAPWVPCETYTGSDGKLRFRSWTDDPWGYAKGFSRPGLHESPTVAAWESSIADNLPEGFSETDLANAYADRMLTEIKEYKARKWFVLYSKQHAKHVAYIEQHAPNREGEVKEAFRTQDRKLKEAA